MNDAGNYVQPVPVNNPLQQVVDRQDKEIDKLNEQLKQKDKEVGNVYSDSYVCLHITCHHLVHV